MLEELTAEQEALMYEVRDEWFDRALFKTRTVDQEEVTPYIAWLYSLAELEAPEVRVVDSPYAAKKMAEEEVKKRKKANKDTEYDWLYCGLGHSSGWVAYYDFFERIGVVDNEDFRKFREFMKCGVWDVIVFDDLAITCNGPSAVSLDGEGRPWSERRMHSIEGPAIQWRDGYKQYYVAGVHMDGDLIENPGKITKERIFGERNVEVRKALIDIVGMNQFMSMTNATELDKDTDGQGMPRRLLEVDAGDGDRWRVVEVECPSKRDKHYLWVPPDMESCSKAIAWTFGFDAVEEYRPLVET